MKQSATLMTYQLPADVIADLPAMAALGFDSIMAYDNGNISTVELTVGLLDACRSNGLRAYVDLRNFVQYGTYSGAALTTRVNAIKSHPALAGWYTYDEPRTPDVPAGQIEAAYTAIKATGDTKPVVGVYAGYGVDWFPSGGGAYPLTAGMHDVFSIDTYPINGSGLNEASYRAMLVASLSVTPSASTERVMTMQACAQGSGQVPTAAQLIRLAEIAVEERWCTRGMWLWLWHWGATLSPLAGYVFLKAMVADSATAAAVRTITQRHRSNTGRGISLGGGSRLRASGSTFLGA